jgi:hypothetical protein
MTGTQGNVQYLHAPSTCKPVTLQDLDVSTGEGRR